MDNNLKSFSIIAGLLAATIMGADYVVLKYLMPKYITPQSLVFIRCAIAFAVFFLISLFTKSKKVEPKDLLYMALIALTCVTIRLLIYFKGLTLTSPIDGSIIMVCVPIIVMIISYFLLKENLSIWKVIGMAIGLIGSIILVSIGHHYSNASDSIKGNAFVFISAVLLAFYYVLIKKFINKYGSFTVTLYLFFFATIFLAPLTYKYVIETDWQSFSSKQWLLIGYVVIIVTIIAYYLNAISLKNLKASTATSFSYLQPIVASICAYIFLNEKMNMIQIISAALIFSGGILIIKNE